MLLTISTTYEPATDLGFLLHKHPERVQQFEQSSGTAHVFYPEADAERCTAALLLEVDPVGLVRGRQNGGFALGQYVNDRPYAGSSLVAIALKSVFGTAFTGVCKARPELAGTAIPLEIHIPSLSCRGGPDIARRVFEPLGWRVDSSPVALEPSRPDWGESRYLDLRLVGTVRLADALNHLYVLLPVLDDAKHYWVGPDEVEKLIRAGGSWLADHPDRTLIAERYLRHRGELAQAALARLAEVDDVEPGDVDNAVPDNAVPDNAAPDVDGGAASDAERPTPLNLQRRAAVLAAVRACGASSVGDLGCGEGALVGELLAERQIARVVAVDVSTRALQTAARRLHLDRMSEPQRARLEIFQSALTYRDDRLAGLDAAVLMEVIEHVDAPRLGALERSVFGHAAPTTVIVTTPNAEHNVRYANLAAGAVRHHDHRFEWTRAEFSAWAEGVAGRFGYTVRYVAVGADDPDVGPPTQLAIFTKAAA